MKKQPWIYSLGVKIGGFVMMILITAFAMVMLFIMSYYLRNGYVDEFDAWTSIRNNQADEDMWQAANYYAALDSVDWNAGNFQYVILNENDEVLGQSADFENSDCEYIGTNDFHFQQSMLYTDTMTSDEAAMAEAETGEAETATEPELSADLGGEGFGNGSPAEETEDSTEVTGGSVGFSVSSKYGEDGQKSYQSEIYEDQLVRVKGYVRTNLTARDKYYYLYHLTHVIYQNWVLWWVLVAVSAICVVLLWFMELAAVGHRKNADSVQLNLQDRIPFDVFTLGYIIAAVISTQLIADTWWYGVPDNPEGIAFLTLSVIAVGGLAISYTLSLATRLKVGGILRRTVCGRILLWLVRTGKNAAKRFRFYVSQFPFLTRQIGAVIGLAVIAGIAMLFFGTVMGTGGILFGWGLEMALIIGFVIRLLCRSQVLFEGGKELAEGNLDATVDTTYLKGALREHGEHLNQISQGMSNAIEHQMKSERMKTELITNVSHDIKTPLTSIINYVDLIQKEAPDAQPFTDYVEVLGRQSQRLKKLIEDLVEASKAATGNLEVNLEPCDVGVLLDQMIGEYAEKLEQSQLDAVLDCPQEPLHIWADGRRIWRVFDNLLNNICKYSMPGTRVYVTVREESTMVMILFRNISKSQLNISSDELMERFVRGDSSRNTEGSGLGLSIAQSLTELQGGKLQLEIDGDLFKVTLRFPKTGA